MLDRILLACFILLIPICMKNRSSKRFKKVMIGLLFIDILIIITVYILIFWQLPI